MAVSPLMGVPRVLEEENQENNKMFSSPFNVVNSTCTNNDQSNNNSSTQQFEDVEEQQQQQEQVQPQHHHQNNQIHNQHQLQLQRQVPFGMMQSSSSSTIPGNYINKDTGGYDLGELDQALFLYLDGHDQEQKRDPLQMKRSQNSEESSSGMKPPTLNIFPSQPMHVEPSTKVNTGLVSPQVNASKRTSQPSLELANPKIDAPSASEPAKNIKREGNRRGPHSCSEQEGPKTPDPKTLRRLAQNREAARKSRLRKKAYVQQLESSRIRLTQLEQELHRARAQGMFLGGSLMGGEQALPFGVNNTSSEAAAFDMEYARWLEENNRRVGELRAAFEERLPDNELRIFLNNCLAHYDDMIQLKSMIAKANVFHLMSGMWKTPAERCFMWMGDFKPSDIIKIIINQTEPTGVTDQQILGIYDLQRSTQEAEEALTQGLESLNHSLSETIASDSLSCPPNATNYMGQMAMAMNKLITVEGFVRQADNLRHQTIHRLTQLLTTRQAARCLLAIAEYFHRLRALSSLWVVRPRQD